MATVASHLERKPGTTVRPGLSHLQSGGSPSSPHTPSRVISSTFSSPATSYRADEESLIFEFGARYLRMGFAGERAPRCNQRFGPEESRRVGDYRRWLPDYNSQAKRRKTNTTWGNDHELWCMDLRGVDLGLVEDKIERAVREAYTKYLLLDTRSRRATVVLPSVIPHSLISIMLKVLFMQFQIPSITLLAAPIMAVTAAGLRSGLVIDIGWHETIITTIYEYREVHRSRTVRAMKLVTLHMAETLQALSNQTSSGQRDPVIVPEVADEFLDVDFQHAEEITARMAWCKSDAENSKILHQSTEDQLEGMRISHQSPEAMIHVPLLLSSDNPTNIPFSKLSEPIESALLASTTPLHDLDDEEQSIPYLLYKSLLGLSPDIRGVCISRIIVTGGGANIPGLKSRLLTELSSLISQRKWDPAMGKAADERRRRLREIDHNRRTAASKPEFPLKSTEHTDAPLDELKSSLPAALKPQTPDPIEDKLKGDEEKVSKSAVSGVVRGVETFGAWAGASLLTALKVRGIVQIERDTFLQHGMTGAKREADVSVEQSRQNYGPGVQRGGVEKVGWTLGAWA